MRHDPTIPPTKHLIQLCEIQRREVEVARRCDFEWPDEKLLALGRRGLRVYSLDLRTSQRADEACIGRADLAELESGLKPLCAVFVECRQYLRRRRIAKAVGDLRKLMSPALEADRTLLARLDAQATALPTDARTVTLLAFLIRRAGAVVAAWEATAKFKVSARNLLVAGIVADMQGTEPSDDLGEDERASQRVTQVLGGVGLTKKYRRY